jgi:beta-N-acetylglucosaminidase
MTLVPVSAHSQLLRLEMCTNGAQPPEKKYQSHILWSLKRIKYIKMTVEDVSLLLNVER